MRTTESVTRRVRASGDPNFPIYLTLKGDNWRVAPEDQPLTARRRQCSDPLPVRDLAGVTCLRCGRSPAIRL